MILDKNLLIDTAASVVSAASGTVQSANVVDLLNARDLSIGSHNIPKVMCLVTTSLLTTNSATIQVVIQGSTDNTNFTNMAMSDAIAIGSTTTNAGLRLLDIDLPRPGPGQSLPRYIGAAYKVATGAITAGAVTTALVLNRQDNVYYPPGIVVSN